MEVVGVRIKCIYLPDRWFQQDKKLISCEARFVKSTTPWEIFIIRKNYSRTNNEVKSIAFMRQTVNYIPVGLEMIFPDLTEIYISECNLLRVDQSNFKPFTELKALSIRANRYLETLERSLFDYNKKLKYINLYCNNFKHIDADLVSGLSFLKYFELEHVTCLNITINGTLMTPLKDLLKSKCQNPVVRRQQNDERNKIIISRFNKLHDDVNSLSKQFYVPTDGSSLIRTDVV